MKDTIQTIRSASHRFFSGTLLSRLTGMLRDMALAYSFGTSASIAAFMVAFRFAHLLRRLFGEGALQSAFIPQFEDLRIQNEQQAFQFFRDLGVALTLFLLVVIGISCSVLGAVLIWGNVQPQNQEILFLTLLMLPSLLFICLYGLNASLLQCEKYYFVSSVAPVAFNVIWIVTVFCIGNLPSDQAMIRLAIGVVIACIFQWLLTVPQTYHSLKVHCQIKSFSFSQLIAHVRLLGKPLVLGILGVAASQINNAIDSVFAHFAEPEGPALLWYAIRIQQLPLALFGISIASSILPPLSRALKGKRVEEYTHFLHDGIERTIFFILPVTVLFFAMGDSIVQLIYGRGHFDAASIAHTTHCLWAYAIGLLPSALVLILAPAYYAQSLYTLPAIISCLTLCCNMGLNSLFIMGFGWGAVSVAYATSCSAWLNFFLLAWGLSRKGMLNLPFLTKKICVVFCFSSLAFLALQMSHGTVSHFVSIITFSAFSSSLISEILHVSIKGLIFGAVFFFTSFLLSLFSLFKNNYFVFFNKK